MKALPKRVKPQTTVNTEAKRKREKAAEHRRMMAKMSLEWGDEPNAQDHLPGSAEDRFGQVYRKGGPRDGIDVVNTNSYGRGYANVENR